jgi:TP901 family phage tail tape measure protein
MGSQTFPLTLALRALDETAKPIKQMTERLKGALAPFASLGKTLSLGVTAPLVGIGAASVAAFSRFETGMANVATLVDTNVESMADMEAGVIAVTRAVKVQPLSEMAEALASIRGAGISAAEQFKVLEGSGKLAAAALGTTAEAADISTSAINAWGLTGDAVGKIYNQVFQAVNTGKMNLSQLAQGFGGVAGTVASAGVKLDEYLASVAALTTTGLPAAEAHTQIKAVIAGLTGQTKEAAAVFQRLNVKGMKELIATSGGLVPALEKIRGVVKDNDTVLLSALGGTEAFNAVIGLTGNQAGAFKQSLDAMRSGADGLGVAFAKQASTSAASLQDMRNELEIAAISVGRALMPAIREIVPVIERAAASWNSLGVESQTSIVVFAGVAAALGPAITVITNLVTVMGIANAAFTWVRGWAAYLWMMRSSIMAGLVPSLAAAASSVWAFTAALLANPITWVVAGVAALAGAAYLIYKNWEPIKAFFAGVWDSLVETLGPVVQVVWEMLKSFTPLGIIAENWAPIADFFKGLWDGIVGVFKAEWAKIEYIIDGVKSAFAWLGSDSEGGLSVSQTTPMSGPAPLLNAGQALPARGGAGAAGEARVVVDFANMPKGARVTPAAGNTADLDLSWGYSMEAP